MEQGIRMDVAEELEQNLNSFIRNLPDGGYRKR
jgi:hypothetical protein